MKIFVVALVIACLVGLLFHSDKVRARKSGDAGRRMTGYIASDSSQTPLVGIENRFFPISNPEVIRIYDIKKGQTVFINNIDGNSAELSRPPL